MRLVDSHRALVYDNVMGTSGMRTASGKAMGRPQRVFDRARATHGVVRVRYGRGFVIKGGYVITAAHCLRRLPRLGARCAGGAELTYKHLLGKLGGRATVWAECVFADPIADIAVLQSPDDQELREEAGRYRDLLDEATPLKVSKPAAAGSAWLLSLAGEWEHCQMERIADGPIWITEGQIRPGMSGSPILADDGSAVGVVCAGPGAGPAAADVSEPDPPHGPQAVILRDLPAWMTKRPRVVVGAA